MLWPITSEIRFLIAPTTNEVPTLNLIFQGEPGKDERELFFSCWLPPNHRLPSYKTSFALRTIKSLRSYTVLIQALIPYWNTKKCIYNYSYGPLILKLFACDRSRSIYKINFAANNGRAGKSGHRQSFIQNMGAVHFIALVSTIPNQATELSFSCRHLIKSNRSGTLKRYSVIKIQAIGQVISCLSISFAINQLLQLQFQLDHIAFFRFCLSWRAVWPYKYHKTHIDSAQGKQRKFFSNRTSPGTEFE